MRKQKLVGRWTVVVSGLLISFSIFTSAQAARNSLGGLQNQIEAVEQDVDQLQNEVNQKQNRVTGVCPPGQAIGAITENGDVVCEIGGPGSGLDADTLDGKHASDFVGSGQSCDSGLVTGIDGGGNIICAQEIYFSAKLTSQVDHTPNCIFQRVKFESPAVVIDNLGDGFNANTGIFTAPASGTYSFSAGVTFDDIDEGDLIYIAINAGGMFYNSTLTEAVATIQGITESITVHLDAGENASMFAYACSSGVNARLFGNSVSTYAWTFFTGARVF